MGKQTSTTKRCECGCKAAVTRRFKPGHDQKLRGALVRGAKAGDAKAIAALREHGFPVPAIAEAKPARKSAAKASTAVDRSAPKARKRTTRKPAAA